MGKQEPPIIEGTYRASERTTPQPAPRPHREPIFNNWRYAAAFGVFILLRLGWVLASRPPH